MDFFQIFYVKNAFIFLQNLEKIVISPELIEGKQIQSNTTILLLQLIFHVKAIK
jgi:hypothetical protein